VSYKIIQFDSHEAVVEITAGGFWRIVFQLNGEELRETERSYIPDPGYGELQIPPNIHSWAAEAVHKKILAFRKMYARAMLEMARERRDYALPPGDMPFGIPMDGYLEAEAQKLSDFYPDYCDDE